MKVSFFFCHGLSAAVCLRWFKYRGIICIKLVERMIICRLAFSSSGVFLPLYLVQSAKRAKVRGVIALRERDMIWRRVCMHV